MWSDFSTKSNHIGLFFTFSSTSFSRIALDLTGLLIPGSDPRLGVHLQTPSPLGVFVGRWWNVAALRCQFFGHGAYVIRLKTAAAADVANAEITRLTGVLVSIPASEQARF